MRKFVIPATICAFALVGAVLLLLPVEDAMAVHTTISVNINKQDRYLAFQISANTTGSSNVVIIPQKVGQVLIVAITTVPLDGVGGFNATFERTGGSQADVTADGTLQTIGASFGLQIKSLAADTEHFISIIIGEDDE